jgi:hypothetical protein
LRLESYHEVLRCRRSTSGRMMQRGRFSPGCTA